MRELPKFIVVTQGIKRRVRVKVQAEYWRVLDGALVFRNSVPGTYPQTVHVFAPGHWLEVRDAS